MAALSAPGNQLKREKTGGIDRTRQRDLPRRHGRKTEASVIGHVADQQHQAEAFGLGARQARLDQRPAETFAGNRWIDHQRPEQKPALAFADADGGEADAAHQTLIDDRAKRQPLHRRHAFAHPIGASGKPARAESLRRKFG